MTMARVTLHIQPTGTAKATGMFELRHVIG